MNVRPGTTSPDTYHTSISSKDPQRPQAYSTELDALTEIPTHNLYWPGRGSGELERQDLVALPALTQRDASHSLVVVAGFRGRISVIATMTGILSLAVIGWKDAPASVAQLLGTERVVGRRSGGLTVGKSSPYCNPGCNQ